LFVCSGGKEDWLGRHLMQQRQFHAAALECFIVSGSGKDAATLLTLFVTFEDDASCYPVMRALVMSSDLGEPLPDLLLFLADGLARSKPKLSSLIDGWLSRELIKSVPLDDSAALALLKVIARSPLKHSAATAFACGRAVIAATKAAMEGDDELVLLFLKHPEVVENFLRPAFEEAVEVSRRAMTKAIIELNLFLFCWHGCRRVMVSWR